MLSLERQIPYSFKALELKLVIKPTVSEATTIDTTLVLMASHTLKVTEATSLKGCLKCVLVTEDVFHCVDSVLIGEL